MPVRIPVISPSGQRGTVPAESLAEARKHGYRYATVKEAEQMADADSPGTALAAGVLRGISAGASDPLLGAAGSALDELTGTSPVRSYGDQLAGMKDENPVASALGEVGGVVGGMVAGGPVAGIAKLGAGARAAAGGGKLGAVASGLVEGGLFGLGTVISETGLGDHQTNVEKLASIGGGGLFGAALNSVTHGLGSAGSALISKLGGKTLSGALDDIANKALWGQVSSKQIMKRRGLLGSEDELTQYALKNDMVPGLGSSEKFAANVEGHRKMLGDQFGEVLGKASSREVMGLEGKMVSQTVAGGFDPLSLARRVETEVLAKLRKDPGAKSSVKAIETYLEDLRKGSNTLAEAHELQSKVNLRTPATETGLRADMKDFGRVFREEIYDQAAQISPHYGSQLRDLSTKYSKTKALQDLAKEKFLKDSAGSPAGIGSLVGAGAGFIQGGPIGGIVAGVASKLAKERGGFIVAAAAEKMAQSRTVETLAKNLKTMVDGLNEQGLLGSYRMVLENAGAKGASALLATHVQLAKSDPMYLPTLGLQNETAEAANQYASKAERLAEIKMGIDALNADIDNLSGRFLGQVPGRASTPKQVEVSYADFERRMARVNQVLRNPGDVDTSLASTAPSLAMSASVQAQTAAQFLLNKAPKNPGVEGLKALSMPWKPSQAELAKFYRYVRVVENPQVVLSDLKSKGHVDVQAAETMRTIYPKLLQDMQNQMMERLMTLQTPISYKQKLGLDSLFGPEFRGGNPRHLALLQQIHADSMAEKEAPKSDGRQTQSQSDNMKTQAQKVAER